jgi:hypothetical protein
MTLFLTNVSKRREEGHLWEARSASARGSNKPAREYGAAPSMLRYAQSTRLPVHQSGPARLG